MKPRVLAMLLLAGNMVFTSVAKAQMWGTGMWGGMQHCPYPYGPAPGASSQSDEMMELRQMEIEAKREIKDLKSELKQIERDLKRYGDAIHNQLRPNWSGVVIEHMEYGKNCCIEGGREPDPGPIDDGEIIPIDPIVEPPPVSIDPPKKGDSAPLPPVDESLPPVPPPSDDGSGRPPRPSTMNIPGLRNRTPASVSRMPAGETTEPYYSDDGNVEGGDGSWGDDIRASGFDGPGMPTLCYPAQKPYTMNAWRNICRDDGNIARQVCADKYYTRGEARGGAAAECSAAIDRYRRLVVRRQALDDKLRALEEQLIEIREARGDLARERRDMEADCPSGECYGEVRARSTVGRANMWPLIAGVGMGILSEYLGYRANDENNDNLNKLGWPTQPYQAGAYGFPFVQAGIYGSIAGSTNGGFGCAPGMGGGGPMSPYGGLGPFGMGGGMGPYGNPWGYPPGMFGYPMMGGGMYNPGMGPWGMPGPWGGGMGMGMPGMGGMMMPGLGGGMMMPGMAGGFGAGMMAPGMMAPGMAGGFGGGMMMPGMAGGFGPGMMAPGMAGGFGAGMMMPGMAGGYPGGMAGGFGGGLMMPGLGGMAPGMAGGYPGGMAGGAMMPGMGGASPWGIAGGFATGFMSPFGGDSMGMQYQQQLMNMQLQQYQVQIEMQRQAIDNAQAKMHVQQGLMVEYYSLMSKIQQFNMGGSGFGLSTGFGGGVGSIGGGYPGAINPIGGPGAGPGTGVPGRNR